MDERIIYMIKGRFMKDNKVIGYRLSAFSVNGNKYINVDRETMVYYVTKGLVINCRAGIREGKVYIYGVGFKMSDIPVIHEDLQKKEKKVILVYSEFMSSVERYAKMNDFFCERRKSGSLLVLNTDKYAQVGASGDDDKPEYFDTGVLIRVRILCVSHDFIHTIVEVYARGLGNSNKPRLMRKADLYVGLGEKEDTIEMSGSIFLTNRVFETDNGNLCVSKDMNKIVERMFEIVYKMNESQFPN